MRGRLRLPFKALSMAALLALGPSASAVEGPDPRLVALQKVSHTKDTHIDFDGDGKPDLVRRFSKLGELMYSESRDRSYKVELKKVFRRIRPPEQPVEIQETVWSREGTKDLVRRETIMISRPKKTLKHHEVH